MARVIVRLPTSFPVTAGDWDEDLDIALVLEMRSVAARQRDLRRAVLTATGERVRVQCRLHLLPTAHESVLQQAIAALDDRLAVLRHCDPSTDQRFVGLLADARRERAALTAQFDDAVIDLDVSVGLPPRGGQDWSLSDVPAGVIDEVNRAWVAMRADLVRAVEHLVASDLARVVDLARTDVALTGHDAETVAQVRAFALEVRRVEQLEQRCRQRLRGIALHAAHADPRSWLAQNQVRSRQARDALDMVRAVHAAVAELDAHVRADITTR